VGAVKVVVGEVVLEVFGERGQLRYERAGEAGAPAFLEDRLLEPFDVALRGWPASARGRFPAKRKRSVSSTARSTRSATRRVDVRSCTSS
jgi:hypothetical protein